MPDCIVSLPSVLRVNRDGLVFYRGTFSSDIAKQITQVHVFEGSTYNYVTERVQLEQREGYQRPALKPRQKKFADYLSARADHETFSPPVILNARGLWHFEASDDHPEFGTLCIRGAANVIDGQHRLGGYIAHFEREKLPRCIDFVAYAGLDGNEEKWVFHTINTNQKGVPSALSVIIDDKDVHNRVARKVAEDSSSPFDGKISMAGQPASHYLWKLNAVATNVKRMFASGAFVETSEESKYDIFVTYWATIRDTHSEAWLDFDRPTKERQSKLLELTGLVAYSRLFDTRFSQHYSATTDTMNWSAIQNVLENMSGRLDLQKNGKFKGQTGEYGAGQMLVHMHEILAQ